MILKRFFKPKWQSTDPLVRIQAARNLDINHADTPDILKRMASLDNDNKVVDAALNRFSDLSTLDKLHRNEISAKHKTAMSTRIIQILCDDQLSTPTVEKKRDYLNKCNDTTIITAVLRKSNDLKMGLIALKQIEDDSILEEVSLNSSLSALRLAAAEKIHQTDALQRLARQLRNRDKKAYRLIKERLDAREQVEKEKEQQKQLALSLLSQIKTLSGKSYFPQYSQKFSLLQKQWKTLEPKLRAASEADFLNAEQTCLATISDENKAQKLREDILNAQREQLKICNELKTLCRDLEANMGSADFDITNSISASASQQTAWGNSAEKTPPSSEIHKRHLSITNHLQALFAAWERWQEHKEALSALLTEQDRSTVFAQLKQILQTISWPADTAPPKQLSLAGTLLGDKKAALKAIKSAEQQTIAALGKKLDLLTDAIESGEIKTANKLYKDIIQEIDNTALSNHPALSQRTRSLHAQLQELNDWQGFSSAHKKEELCEKMEALIGLDIDLDDKANQIKLLHEQWKASGHSDRKNSQQQWLRFKQAADTAYEPCKDHFSSKASQRQDNLNERLLICEQLQQFISSNNWANADWKSVEEINRVARQQWRQHSPVDRSKGAAAQNQFNDLLSQLKALINQEKDKNTDIKEALVSQAEALTGNEDCNEAIRKIKQLQSDWKATGISHRKADEALWKKFRAHCDTVFQNKNEASQQKQKHQNTQVTAAEDLCRQLENAANENCDSLLKNTRLPAQLRKQLLSISDIPPAQHESIKNNFDKIADFFQSQLTLASAESTNKQLIQLRKLAQFIENIETSESETELDQLQLQWQQRAAGLPEKWLKPMLKRFKQALKSADINTDKILETAIDERKAQLCIRIEILARIDSPDYAKSARMAYQVERLTQEFKQSEKLETSPQEKALELEIEWLSLAHTPKHSQMESRFTEGLNAIGKDNTTPPDTQAE